MKTVNPSEYDVVRGGIPYTTTLPIVWEDVGHAMERQDAYVYWLQPKGKGLSDQFPCVVVNEAMYLMNLKLQKAIFRHIRVSKRFRNEEVLEDGSKKLRIPTRLLAEKRRSSQRFLVRSPPYCASAAHVCIFAMLQVA